jgi:hypothetical protein
MVSAPERSVTVTIVLFFDAWTWTIAMASDFRGADWTVVLNATEIASLLKILCYRAVDINPDLRIANRGIIAIDGDCRVNDQA